MGSAQDNQQFRRSRYPYIKKKIKNKNKRRKRGQRELEIV
jgi:hypothetical protein